MRSDTASAPQNSTEEETLGRRIKRLRNKLGMTPIDFAKAVGGVNTSTVLRWENDESKPGGEYLMNMFKIAGGAADLMIHLVGISSQSRYQALLNDEQERCHPDEGVLVYIDVKVEDRVGVFAAVLNAITAIDGNIGRFTTTGGPDERAHTRAVVLFTTNDMPGVMRLREQIEAIDNVLEVQILVSARSPISV